MFLINVAKKFEDFYVTAVFVIQLKVFPGGETLELSREAFLIEHLQMAVSGKYSFKSTVKKLHLPCA